MYVDADGRRFIAEDEPSIDRKERALHEAVPDLTFHVVFDERARLSAPPIVIGWSADQVARTANRREGVVSASSLEGLALAASIDPGGLRNTVAAYNAALRAAAPDPLGRTHRPAPVAEPRSTRCATTGRR